MTQPTEGQLPVQSDPELEPKTPSEDDAGEGAKNSAKPVTDDAHPETIQNTSGF
jgi:hypothetical protein